ncbi:helix-turn-helix domain-containing protein [Iodobacter sp. LRB]|uniref:helix-turn-helix domain-containing protein n=1 Tax=unclassified Iodobacter TaxID=235634 RepID=UPI000C0F61B6|nr:helix-turn-helix domain-containing protein [Iodobacter sp. BJB302]PHU99677.1 hypothetical protein CSQ88_21230 [Iodobacter sp. BJB302]
MMPYSLIFKIEVLRYVEKVGSVAKAAHKFRMHPSTIYSWKYIGIKEFQNRAGTVVLPPPVAENNSQKLEKRLHFLEKENAVLREATKLYLSY